MHTDERTSANPRSSPLPSPKPLPFAGFRSPTYTPVPDELFDELLSRLSGAELKVLLYIIRRTFGFKKQAERISLSQIRLGITTRDGRVLDQGTGLSLSATQAAIKGLVAKGAIIATRNRSAEKGDQATTYSLRLRGQQQPEGQPDTGYDPRSVSDGEGDSTTTTGGEGQGGTHSREVDAKQGRYPSAPMSSLLSPGTENRQGGILAFGTGGYRESAPQETGSQQTEISVRSSKAARQEGGGGEPGARAALTDRGGTTSTHPTESAGPASRIGSEDNVTPLSHAVSLQPSTHAFRSSPRTVQSSTPRSLGEVLAVRSAQLAPPPGQGQGQGPQPQPQQRVRDRFGRVKPTAQVAVAVTEIAQEFGDLRHLGANCTQAMHLWESSGCSESALVSALYEARAITKQQPRVSNRMSYFWTVVRDLVGLLDNSLADHRELSST